MQTLQVNIHVIKLSIFCKCKYYTLYNSAYIMVHKYLDNKGPLVFAK